MKLKIRNVREINPIDDLRENEKLDDLDAYQGKWCVCAIIKGRNYFTEVLYTRRSTAEKQISNAIINIKSGQPYYFISTIGPVSIDGKIFFFPLPVKS